MSILAGKASFSRFITLGANREKIKNVLSQKLKENRITPIGDNEAREESYGWCNPFNESIDFPDCFEFMSGNYLCLGVRVDTKVVPAKLLKIKLNESIKESCTRLNMPKLPKAQAEQLKEQIKLRILETIPPAITVTKAVFDIESNRLYVETFSQKIIDKFEELFVRSFGIPMIPLVPGTLKATKANYDKLVETCPWHMYNINSEAN